MAFTFATLQKFKEEWWEKPPDDAFTGAVKWQDGEHVGSGSFGDVRKFRIAVLGEKEAWIVVKKLKSAELDVGPLNANLAKREHQVVLPTLTVGKHTFPPVYRSARCLDEDGNVEECIVCFMGEYRVFENDELMPVLHSEAPTKEVQETQMNAIKSLISLCTQCLTFGIAVPDFKLKNIGYVQTQSRAGVAVFDVRLLDLEGLIFTKNCFAEGGVVEMEYTYVPPFHGVLEKRDYGKAGSDAMAESPEGQLIYLTAALMFLAALGIANWITMDEMAVFTENRVPRVPRVGSTKFTKINSFEIFKKPGERFREIHDAVELQYAEVCRDANPYIAGPLEVFHDTFYTVLHSWVESDRIVSKSPHGRKKVDHGKYIESGKSLIAAFAAFTAFTDKTLFCPHAMVNNQIK